MRMRGRCRPLIILLGEVRDLEEELDKYLQLLNNPPLNARGFTRWWWYGGAVSRREINRELNFMKESGIGGVEIQVLYALSEDSEEDGIKNQEYFSPEFFELLVYAVDVAEGLGIEVDVTLSSGWPFGGPFVTDEMAPQVLIPYQQDVNGPCVYHYDLTTIVPGKPEKVVMGKMEQGKLIESSLRDITDKLGATYLHGWPWGFRLNDVEIPDGHWKIYYFVLNPYKQKVGIPARGMEGNAIDHCRADVTEYYLKTFGEPFVKHIGKKRIRTFFCDSIELTGNNWTSILLEEFQKRRGYDLTPYMPALWGEVGEITPYVRFDYYQTFSELTIENFFQTFTDWCHSVESRSRIQAHGTWGDILKAYAAADIPEGETFGHQDQFRVNTVHRRLASSAAHVYGKKVVSNESFTWLRMPRFLVTLEMMKAAVDAIFLDGMNHIINHGYSYSPESAGKPGWAFYASSFISHNNLWWEYYPILSKYMNVVSGFLQQGRPFAEVGIYLPQADIWSTMPMAELHMAMKLEEHIGSETVNRIQKAGYYFDYLNDEALTSRSSLVPGGVEIEGNLYRVIVLPNVSRMSVDTAEKLHEFVLNGGGLIALVERPHFSCGLKDRELLNQQLRKTMQQLFSEEADLWKTVGKGRTIVVSDRDELMLKALNDALVPDLYVEDLKNDKAHNEMGYIHRKDGNHDIYFVSNISEKEHFVRLHVKCHLPYAVILDPMEQKVVGKLSLTDQNRKEIECRFESNQSFLIIFMNDLPNDPEIPPLVSTPRDLLSRIDISNDWSFAVPEKRFTKELERVVTWERFEALRFYSGYGYYEKEVVLPKIPKDQEIHLEIQHVHEVAEVFVNGQSAGVMWKDPRQVNLTHFVKEGRNVVKIKVTNLWINHMLAQKVAYEENSSEVSDSWPYFMDIIHQTRKRRLSAFREQSQVKKPAPSGLAGKVVLKICKRP